MGQATRPGSYGGLRVLIAGGGVAGLEAMLALQALAGDLVDVELLSPEHHFWYRPLSVAEPFQSPPAIRFELAGLTEAAGACYTPGELGAVDTDLRIARTSHGAEIAYDMLVIACGASPRAVLPEALTFRGPGDVDRFRGLLNELEAGSVRRVAFALPSGAVWTLPLYELALLTAAHLEEQGIGEVELMLVTPEAAPLAVFGRAASEAVAALLAARKIATHLGRYATAFEEGELHLVPEASVAADRVVALPRLVARPIAGIPHDGEGFVATDEHGRVRDFDDVYAAGDITRFPVKQGGIAAQQADAAAEDIAARAGAELERHAFDPILRGLVLTGSVAAYLRTELRSGRGDTSTADSEALWWPPAKIAGRYLAPFLAERAGLVRMSQPRSRVASLLEEVLP
jgi:sulfide:quinone oxidoreductase